MRATSLSCILILIMQYVCGQNYNTTTTSILLRKVTLQLPKVPQQYNLNLTYKKLRTARRCIIAGSVLTATGGAMMVAGAIYVFVPKPAVVVQPGGFQPHHADPTAPAIWISSIPLLAPGIPVLAIGLVQRKKWKRIKDDVTVQTGILQTGQIGLAINF